MNIQDMVTTLNHEVGPTLVAFVANVRDRHLPTSWESGAASPSEDEVSRLNHLHFEFFKVATEEGADIARVWLIGTDPRSETSPAFLLRHNLFEEASIASSSFLEGQFA